MLEAMAKFGVTHLATAPTAYKAMLSQPALDDALKIAQMLPVRRRASARARPGAAWKERTGISIVDGIGSTEMMHIFISESGDAIRPGSTGRAVPGYEATVLDADGKPMAEGEGRLAVKGPTGCRYLDDPRQANYVEDGWNITGDTYRKDADGYFWYLARSDDMIVSSRLQYRRAGSGECAARPPRGRRMRGDRRALPRARPEGEGVRRRCADCRRRATSLFQKLKNFVKATIAPYKYPREIEFVDALPKTATGKLRRVELEAAKRQRRGPRCGALCAGQARKTLIQTPRSPDRPPGCRRPWPASP